MADGLAGRIDLDDGNEEQQLQSVTGINVTKIWMDIQLAVASVCVLKRVNKLNPP